MEVEKMKIHPVVGAEILEQVGNAGERPRRQPGGDRGLRQLVHAIDNGIDDGIALLDARDRGVQQLSRGHRPRFHQIGEAETVIALVLFHGARALQQLPERLA